MKAFKKWDTKNYPLPATIERGPVGRDMLKQREHGWKAALEWALETARELGHQDDIGGTIERELEE